MTAAESHGQARENGGELGGAKGPARPPLSRSSWVAVRAFLPTRCIARGLWSTPPPAALLANGTGATMLSHLTRRTQPHFNFNDNCRDESWKQQFS